jgi:hypothetical protein
LGLLENSEIKRHPIGNHGNEKRIQVVERNYDGGASYHILTPTNRSLLD